MSQNARILVVDDDLPWLHSLSHVLGGAGYEVRQAANGEDALSLVADRVPDLILLDIRMPDMDGFEVFRRLRAHEEWSGIPIIMLSGVVEAKERAAGIEMGASDFITKPFDIEELLARVRMQLEMARLRTELQAVNESRLVLATREAEEEKAQIKDQLQQLQKMESVGRLAGGVAHDFNNMLGVIIGHAELAMEQTDPESQVHADLQEILAAADRSADLTRQLLAFSRQQTISPKEINLSDAIAGMLKMLNRLIGEDIQLTFVPGKDLWPVKMDPSQVDQVLANLCVNARDAIADVGTIAIETDNCTLDEGFCAAHAAAGPGDYVRLTVSDTGCGMDKETISHIFEPFFTTKEMGKGTGLGLATVYGIVSQNGGLIDAYSEPGMGTKITVYLARHLSIAAGEQVEGDPEPHARGHETILLVEDEPAILNMTKSLLERQGYTVLAANTPANAIRLAQEHAIHMLMTDVVMPEMNGRDLAGILRSSHPHLRVLFMSGYTASAISHHGVLDPGVCFIQKPFSVHDLASTVRRTLDQAQA